MINVIVDEHVSALRCLLMEEIKKELEKTPGKAVDLDIVRFNQEGMQFLISSVFIDGRGEVMVTNEDEGCVNGDDPLELFTIDEMIEIISEM